MTDFKVRLVRRPPPRLLKGIITLYRSHGWWKPGDTAAGLRGSIAGSHCFAVAVSDGRVIGIGRAISDGASDAYIQDMAVLPEARSKGVGTALLKAVMDRLHKDGITWVALIAQDNSAHFYRKAGFRALKRAHPMLSSKTYV